MSDRSSTVEMGILSVVKLPGLSVVGQFDSGATKVTYNPFCGNTE